MSAPLRVAVRTQGCKVNLFDQWEVEDGLRKLTRPVAIVGWDDDADVYVVNTCTVTGQADRQNRQLVHQVHRRAPEAAIVVTGCQASVDPDGVAALPGVVRVVPNTAKADLPEIIAEIAPQTPAAAAPQAAAPRPRTRPLLKVQDGCETGCTYCILPRARGPSRSMAPSEVVERLQRMGGEGAAEVVLTGLNLGEYGLDLRPRTDLAGLLRRIEDARPAPRIRLSSVEPRGMREPLIELLASSRAICHHLHLPLQAGADAVLKAMHRPYRRRWFLDLCARLVDVWPDVSLGTDVICGFPGETLADFAQTVEVCRDARLSYLHAFPYSARPGTPAWRLPDDVPEQEKRRRVKTLRRLSDERRRRFAAAHVGRRAKVVVEQRAADGLLQGLTGTYLPVRFPGGDGLLGRLVPVTVDRVEGARGFGSPSDAGWATP